MRAETPVETNERNQPQGHLGVSMEEAAEESPADLFAELGSSSEGLSDSEAQKRLEQHGYNELEAKRENPLRKLLSYFWGPIPWMIEVAAILSAAVRHWMDLYIIVFLLVFNAVVGFLEEHEASNALAALKEQLALNARIRRNGQWQEIPARELVPGDVIRLRLGDIIPADVKLVDGDYLSIDQSALTGESLPVNKKPGEIAYSGSVVKQGEMVALVTATGADTFFARTAKLVETAGAVSHFQKAVMRVGNFLIFIAMGLSTILIAVELLQGARVLRLLEFVLILVVASIPVAMPAVLSVTMALGAVALSRMKAIVSRLQSIEEMAGIDILCSDKTGTLTQNQLTLGEAVTFAAKDPQELILMGALASKEENRDAIDLAILGGLRGKEALQAYHQEKFVPFDPITKRTEADVHNGDGSSFKVSKGAPQVILDLCRLPSETRQRADRQVEELAAKGYRTLGIARTQNGGSWQFLGILPLYDPPREDSAQIIADAMAHGIQVKMVTGDDVAIAKETASQLEMGFDIQPVDQLFPEGCACDLDDRAAELIEDADGFARVFPEHKYHIVKALQERGHLVAMTGDGVNDAPALKQAEVGVAVSGATNAAQAAAALVLTKSGLSVIISAVEEARRIFERMMSYTIYRIAMSINIMVFVVLAMLTYHYFPLTAMMIILIALLDDIPIMSIAYDNTYLNPQPVRWDMHRVLNVSTVLGFLAMIESFALMLIGKEALHLNIPHLQTLLFVQLVTGGHLMLFLTRTKKWFWQRPFPSWQLFSAIMSTQVLAILLAGFGWLVPALSWRLIGAVLAYSVVWMFILEGVKMATYRILARQADVR